MIFCGNKESEEREEKSLIDSLFNLTSDDLFNSSTVTSSSWFLIAETLTARAPDVNWQVFLQREMSNRGL